MLRRKIRSTLARAPVCLCLAAVLSAIAPQTIARQDVGDFAGKSLSTDRWLASLVSAPSHSVLDPFMRPLAEPVIINRNGGLFGDADLSGNAVLEGFVLARTPEIARMLAGTKIANRTDKGDLPLNDITRIVYAPRAMAIFDRSALLHTPDEALWPASSLKQIQIAAEKSDLKADRPTRKRFIEGKPEAPLALVPNAALAAIKADAAAQAGREVDAGLVTAAVLGAGGARQGYAREEDDPRAIFDAVLQRGDGKATLPDAPSENPETPLDVTIEEASVFPIPRLKPEVIEALDLAHQKPKSRLHFWASFNLPGSVYKKNEQRCLAAAIYFESRGESEEGQAAVAQVVLNRVKAPAYPDSICGVVYQNKNWRNRCQFSFACDGIYDRVKDTAAWERAVRIARDVSKGKIYLDKVADSTHYHATYVSPNWRKQMKVVDRIGVHIFYRTRNGGWS